MSKLTVGKPGEGGLKANASTKNLDSSESDARPSSNAGRSSKKVVAFDEMPGNNKRKKPKMEPKPEPPKPEPPKPEPPKPEPKKPEPKPEPMIVPLKPEKVKEKTIIREEAKIVNMPMTKNVIKRVKEKKIFVSNPDYDQIFINLQDNQLSSKYFKPKLLKKISEDGRIFENPLDQHDDDFVKIEIPLTIVQKEVMPEKPPLVMENRILFTVPGKVKPTNVVNSTDLFQIEAIRVFKESQENCDYDTKVDELKSNSDKNILLKKHKTAEFITRTQIIKVNEVKPRSRLVTTEDENADELLQHYEEEKLTKHIKKLFKDEIDRVKFELNEIKMLQELNLEKIRGEEEKMVEGNKKLPDRTSKLSKLKDAKPKIEAINVIFDKKTAVFKKVIHDIAKTWREMNEEGAKEESSEKGIQISSAGLNDSITREDEIEQEQIKIQKEKEAQESAKGKKGKKEDPKATMTLTEVSTERKYFIKRRKSKDDLKEYFESKLRAFKAFITGMKIEYEVSKDYIIEKTVEIVFERKIGGDVLRLFETGAVEVITSYGANYKIFQDGHQVTSYQNRDSKQIFLNGNIFSFNAQNKSICHELPLESCKVIRYLTGRIEQVLYNSQVKLVLNDGKSTCIDPLYGEYSYKS